MPTEEMRRRLAASACRETWLAAGVFPAAVRHDAARELRGSDRRTTRGPRSRTPIGEDTGARGLGENGKAVLEP